MWCRLLMWRSGHWSHVLGLLLVLSAVPMLAQSAVLIYPGTGACSSSFSNCLGSANPNDSIEIASNDPITDTQIIGTKAVSIRPAPGFQPVFAAGVTVRLSVQANQGGNVQIEGLRLLGGSLVVEAFDAVQVQIRNNRIDSIQGSSYSAGIHVNMPSQVPTGTGQLDLGITGNSIFLDGPANTSGISATRTPSSTDYPFALSVTDNRIMAIGSSQENGSGFGRSGIRVQDGGNNAVRIRIERNQLLEDAAVTDGSARLCNGIIVNANQAASYPVRLASNLVLLKSNCGSLSSGIWINPHPDNTIQAAIVNNTIISGANGIRIGGVGWPGNPEFHIDALIANNLISQIPGAGVVVQPLAAGYSVSNHHNAFFQVAGFQNFTPGPATQSSDPQTIAPRHRLASSSPLRDIGDAAAFLQAMPNLEAVDLDADGLRRQKGSNIDLGAFEFGDASYLIDIPTTNPSPLLLINQSGLNGVASALLHVTRTDGRAADGYVAIPNPLSSYYEVVSQRWHVRSENGNALPPGGGLSLWSAALGETATQYLVGLDSLTTPNAARLPEALANLPTNYLFLVTPTRGVGTIGFVDTHPVGAKHLNGQWHLTNTDGAPIDVGSAFVVYAQAPNLNAFVHTVSDANRVSSTESRLDHPLLNGAPCATVHVSVNGEGLLPTRDVSAHYDAASGYWRLRLEEVGPMLFNNNRYNVLIDPRAVDDACRLPLLSDGFEGA